MLTKLLAAVALLCALTAGVNSIEADKLFASGQPCTMNGDTPTCVPCTGVDTSAEVDLGDSYIVFNGESFNSLFVSNAMCMFAVFIVHSVIKDKFINLAVRLLC